MRKVIVLACLSACSAKHQAPELADASYTISMIQGDACAANVDRFRCELAAGCVWNTIGGDCPGDGSYCQSGACLAPTGGGLGFQGACACDGSDTCFEQIAGPVIAATVQCATPSPGTGEVCARIVGQGACLPSRWIQGLCICDSRI